jgi:hypothetical protein
MPKTMEDILMSMIQIEVASIITNTLEDELVFDITIRKSRKEDIISWIMSYSHFYRQYGCVCRRQGEDTLLFAANNGKQLGRIQFVVK